MGTTDFVVAAVERQRLHVPFHARCAATMTVRGPGWSVVDLYRITLANGAVGVGETIVGYTWGAASDSSPTIHRSGQGQD